jgi:hypothetical protein
MLFCRKIKINVHAKPYDNIIATIDYKSTNDKLLNISKKNIQVSRKTYSLELLRVCHKIK